MSGYIQGTPRGEQSLMPRCHDDFVGADSPVRALDAFVDTLDLASLGFAMRDPATVGRPGFHPATLVRIYLWGYLRRTRSSRGLERATRAGITREGIASGGDSKRGDSKRGDSKRGDSKRGDSKRNITRGGTIRRGITRGKRENKTMNKTMMI